MTETAAPDVQVDLVALRCSGCGADVPIADQDSVSCPYCAQSVRVPEAHRRAVRLVRSEDTELRRAEREWQRYARDTWPRWVATLLAFPPSVVLAGSLSLGLCAKLGVLELYTSPRMFIGEAGLVPLIMLVGLAVLAYWSSRRATGIRLTRLSLAARPGKVPSCRTCGAPLAISGGALFVRCPYCRTDSLVTVDALAAHALVANIEQAESSASTALESARARRDKARWAARWMALVWFGMLGLLLLWAFVPAVDFALALVLVDMLALSMLTYMMAMGSLVDSLERSGRRTGRLSGILGLLAFLLAIASSAAVWILAG